MSQWGAVNFSHPQSRNVQLENDYNPANSNEVIRRAIVLDKNHQTYERIVFSISWDLPAFMANQYKTKCPLGSVITLSGTAMYAQAITCEEYSKMNWHKYGLEVLIILQRALDSSDLTYSGKQVQLLSSNNLSSPMFHLLLCEILYSTFLIIMPNTFYRSISRFCAFCRF